MMMKKILIVEDEALIADDLEDRLLNMGYDVVGKAASGAEALSIAHAMQPDLALLDIRIDGLMDGIETAEEIHYQLKIPVIFLTAHADDETLNRAKSASALGYLVKPVRDRDLKAALEIGFNVHHLQSTLHRTDAWLRGVMRNVDCGIITLALDGEVRSVNDAAASICGSALEGLQVQEAISLFDRENKPISDLLVAALMQSRPRRRRGLLQLKNGTRIPVRYVLVPVSADSEILGSIVIIRRVRPN
jgi:PAS domain S-box-containing protein